MNHNLTPDEYLKVNSSSLKKDEEIEMLDSHKTKKSKIQPVKTSLEFAFQIHFSLFKLRRQMLSNIS